MLRATRDLSDASAFLGSEYEAVIVLLATFTAAEVPQWEHLHHTLAELSDAITLPDVGVFQTWVPCVRRFSYVLSPGNR
jgi:hypothetical protein